jgi:hypothetical protein
MMIQKNGREYTVTELAKEWKIERTVGGLLVEYRLPKEAASTVEDVEKYVAKNELF